MQTMTVEEFRAAARGEVFTVCFIKRTDGTRRVMNARFGVKRHLRGGELKYVPAEKRLLGPVYDMKGNPDDPESPAGYKMINLLSVIWLRWGRKAWGWDPAKELFVEQDPDFEAV